MEYVDHGYSTGDHMSLVEITVVNFEFLAFKEMITWNSETFLGAFGGALGLWLELNFINITYQLILVL
jgi:hypothetical protein